MEDNFFLVAIKFVRELEKIVNENDEEMLNKFMHDNKNIVSYLIVNGITKFTIKINEIDTIKIELAKYNNFTKLECINLDELKDNKKIKKIKEYVKNDKRKIKEINKTYTKKINTKVFDNKRRR